MLFIRRGFTRRFWGCKEIHTLVVRILSVSFLTVSLVLITLPTQAQPAERVADTVRKDIQKRTKETPARARPKPPPGNFYRYDDRYRHDRYYPRFGHIAPRLPDRRLRIIYRDRDYFYYSGIWYRPHGLEFEVIAPPIGIYVPVLPSYYTTLWIHGVPYYYANDVYYVWRADRDRYQVVEPPLEAENKELPLVGDELFIYPKEGQSEQQIADDRYQCHVWSRDQTQYDPTQPPTNLTVAELNGKRDDYQRAMRACLEGRGYSVR